MDSKYNEIIENYLVNDKTKSAIMLIGGWGTGKSYYIQNVLKPYLNDKRKNSCIIVSLYGLKDIKEISKAIYLEIRAKKLSNIDEKTNIAKIAGKTIVKGVTSFFGIDLSKNDDDLQKLYESIDLTNKLIILEDLERSSLSIKEVLGYVNNLVEQDGIKVMLVANEKELVKSEEVITGKDDKGKDIKEWKWTKETKDYFKIKEKTISDTIPYVSDYLETIKSILNLFKDKEINNLIEEKLYEGKTEYEKRIDEKLKGANMEMDMIAYEIIDISNKVKVLNFRSLIFACQKSIDILRMYNKKLDKKFVKYLFMGIVAFSFRLKTDDKLYWDEKQNGNSLGTSKYPLFRFAHDYIKYQIFDEEGVKKEEQSFLEQYIIESQQGEAKLCLDVIYNFCRYSSSIVEAAVYQLKSSLAKKDIIDCKTYGKIANYLIVIRGLIENNAYIDECKDIMKVNLKTQEYDGEKVYDRLSFHDSFSFWTEKQKQEYDEFVLEMKSIINIKRNTDLKFDYKKEEIDNFIKQIYDNRDDYVNQHTFMKRVDINKLLGIIKLFSVEQIDDLRGAFRSVYSFSNIDEYFMEDKSSLVELRDGINVIISDEAGVTDKIKKLQLSWFVDNLTNIIDRLNKA